MQSKKHSTLESFGNLAIGYIVAICSQIVIFPLFEIETSLPDNLAIGLYFSVISFFRSYILRRVFNRIR